MFFKSNLLELSKHISFYVFPQNDSLVAKHAVNKQLHLTNGHSKQTNDRIFKPDCASLTLIHQTVGIWF